MTMKSWRTEHRSYYNKLNKNKADVRRPLLNDLKAHPCTRCGIMFPPCAMDFHHRDPNTKLFTIGSRSTRNWDQLLSEIAKCDLYCANCHRIIEFDGIYT